ncbi:hypothetical protein [Dactylosporangium sp. NPDC048998]|uniref:hypothetical protein n=1 Tax=Dactylosporangium sp. NPDC048998 TaxID=3363976 RepID=UPI0037138BA2
MKGVLVPLCVAALVPLACLGLGLAFLDGYLTGDRQEAVAVVRKYLEYLRVGDADGAYGLLCPEIVADGTYTVADHRYYLRSRPSIGSIETLEDVDYEASIDGTYVTVQLTGTDADGQPLDEEYKAGLYTAGMRVCDAMGWSELGMSVDPGPSPSPLPGR